MPTSPPNASIQGPLGRRPLRRRDHVLLLGLAVACSLAVCSLARPQAAHADQAPPTVRVAGIVLKWIRGDKGANYRRLEPMVRTAAAGGAKIVCTTECFLDGYAIADKSIPLETYRALGEPIPAERTSRSWPGWPTSSTFTWWPGCARPTARPATTPPSSWVLMAS